MSELNRYRDVFPRQADAEDRRPDLTAAHAPAWLKIVCLIAILVLLCLRLAFADTTVPMTDALSGGEFDYTVNRGDTLSSISSRYGVAQSLLATSNSLKLNSSLHRGQILHIDNRHVVPKVLARGIIINIPQRMLFFFDGGALVSSYPVSLGRTSWRTPVGQFTIIQKRENPTWLVPESIQEEMEEKGEPVKTCVPPGPDNPLGHYALDLSITSYRIHGTIAPLSIYHFSTHGCIRLHPADIEDLYKRVKVGDRGELIYEPVMLARLPDGRIFLEVNRAIYRKSFDPLQQVRAAAETQNLAEKIDWSLVAAVAKNADGIAREVQVRSAGLESHSQLSINREVN